jgi:hypothetical protein
MLLILLACGDFGLDSGIPDDDACAESAVCIHSIDPDWGPIAGGTSLTIEGRGFEGDVLLYFGNAPLDITVITDQVITLSTPSVPAEGSIDVTVTSDLGDFTSVEGFTYASSDPDPDADTDADTDSDTDSDSDSDTDIQPTGLVEGLVEMSYLAYACPGCFGLSSPLAFSIGAAFHEPASSGWYDHLPPKGNCTTTITSSSPASTYKDLGTWAYLTSGANNIPLQKQTVGGQPVYQSAALGQNDLIKNAYFDLSVPDAGMEVDSVLQTPSGFDAFEPSGIGLDDPNAFTTIISRNNATFSWSPAGVSESFIVQVDVYAPDGSSYDGSVLCHTDDVGSATLPAAGFSAYANGSLLAISLLRMEFSSEVNPDSGNIIQGAAQLGLIGTGRLGG